jgi:hypothetical protein
VQAIHDASIDLDSEHGSLGTLHIACLGDDLEWNVGIPYLVDAGDESEAGQPIQLLEESEYRYWIDGASDEPISLQPSEIFSRDDDSGLRGRLKTGRFVGTVAVTATVGAEERSGTAAFEVRSRKLDYLSDFQWMLNRIASEATDLLLAHFAPASVSLKPDGEEAGTALYSRFALLRSLLQSDELDSAIHLILNRPHSEYRSVTEYVHPSRGLRGGRHLAKALTGPGPRQEIRSGVAPRGLTTLPVQVEQVRHAEIVDTVPNRFVRYALGRWRDVAGGIAERLEDLNDAASLRGQDEAAVLIDYLDRLLAAPLFTEVGELDQFPAGNQVLQRREGYRDLFRAFFEIEAAATIEWGDTDDVFPAGSKDVATLYEYWVYLELARIIREMPTFVMDQSTLIEPSAKGLTLNLRQGNQSVVRGHGSVNGRSIDLELFYNKTFPRSKTENGAWTRSVRPDCSLHIRSSGALGARDDVWLHFDAKYRVHNVYEAFGQDNEGDDPKVVRSHALTDDLLKMHTYLDAIKRSAGSYVLYPGQVPDASASRFERYHEILPGIGAFALRPTAAGTTSSDSESVLHEFIGDVIRYVTTRGTGLERADYWTQRTYGAPVATVPPTSSLAEPPADTLVLIGFVKSPEHWEWIEQTGLYNLRADDRPGSVDLSSRLLDARFLLLHGREGTPPRLVSLRDEIFIRTADELLEMGYPDPGGDRYVCVDLRDSVDGQVAERLSNEDIVDVKESVNPGGVPGTPVVATWTQIFEKGRSS